MNNQNQNILDDDRIGRLLLKLTIPAFFSMAVMALYNAVDTIFIGHYVGPLGIGGLSLVFPVQMLIMGIGLMTGIGGASLISRLIGAGNFSRAEHALGNALSSTFILSVILTIAGLSNTDTWLRLIGASETVLPYAWDYMRIILIGMFFQALSMTLGTMIRAEGNARVPMTGMVMGAVLNIILDAVFIIPLEMGVKGAAWATVVAQMVSVAYFASYYYYGKSFLKFHWKNLVIEWSILRAIFAIGISGFTMTIASSASAIFMNKMLVAYGGDTALAAFGVLHRLMMFATMPGITIGQGLQPILGFNYGAKRYDRALKGIKMAIIASTACCLAAFLVIYFFPEPLIRIFTNDSELIAQSTYAAKILFSVLYLVGFIMVGSTIFQAIGKAVQAFITSISRPALFTLPLVFILPHFWQLDGVWLATPAADAFTFIVVLVLLIPELKVFHRMSVSARTANAEI